MYRSNDDSMTASIPVDVPAHARHAQHKLGRVQMACKRGFDIVAALVFFIVFGPALLAVAIGVKLSSPGPIFYSQARIGRHGRSFRFYKFRSMVTNADEVLSSFLDTDEEAKSQWDAFQKLDNDPRITPFGRFIRKTSLDEFPQLWNVLVGDMSIVGPRPCMPGQKNLYGSAWASYCAVRPGLTGLWQVSGRNKLTYAQRVQLDAKYVAEWSFWMDMKLLFKTIRVVVTGDGSR